MLTNKGELEDYLEVVGRGRPLAEPAVENSITYVAMDTHKKEHKVALHYPGDERVLEFTVKNSVREIKKMVNKVKKQAPSALEFCYEAGVCGFSLKRTIESLACSCAVIAHSSYRVTGNADCFLQLFTNSKNKLQM
ncbi:MAG TPA: hypothetical protein VMX13_10110 [Sedimentisphaerales bacterium]|nr:hypothetical protein [Sedimentisphaerales bacterium]